MLRTRTRSGHTLGPTIVLLAVLVLLLLPAVAQAASGTVTWQGRGVNPDCYARFHFVLTPGGTTVLQSGTLTVHFTGGGTATVTGQHMGGSQGALHFFVTGQGPVVSASATVVYTGSLSRSVLTISDATCLTTTTTVGGGTTTTTQGTTTTSQSTTTTQAGTTTTAGETSTTVAGGTSTTVAGVTSTTVAGATSTTGTVVAGASTTSTLQTPSRIETGGGGTAGNDRGLLAAVITSVLAGLSLVTGKLAWSKLR